MSLAVAAPPFGEDSQEWQNVRSRFSARLQTRSPQELPHQQERELGGDLGAWAPSPGGDHPPNVQARTFRPSPGSRGRGGGGYRGGRGRRSPYSGPDANLPRISEDGERGEAASLSSRGERGPPGGRRQDRGGPAYTLEGGAGRQFRDDRRDDLHLLRRRHPPRGTEPEDEGGRRLAGEERREGEDAGRRREGRDRPREGGVPLEEGREADERTRLSGFGRPIRRPTLEWHREPSPGVSGFTWAEEGGPRRRSSGGRGGGLGGRSPADYGEGRDGRWGGGGEGARKRSAGRDPDDFYARGGKASKSQESQREAMPPGLSDADFPSLPRFSSSSSGGARPSSGAIKSETSLAAAAAMTKPAPRDSSTMQELQPLGSGEGQTLTWAQQSAELQAEEDAKASETEHTWTPTLTAAQRETYSQAVKKRFSSFGSRSSDQAISARSTRQLLRRPSRDSPPKQLEVQAERVPKTLKQLSPTETVWESRGKTGQAGDSSTDRIGFGTTKENEELAKPQRETPRLRLSRAEADDRPLNGAAPLPQRTAKGKVEADAKTVVLTAQAVNEMTPPMTPVQGPGPFGAEPLGQGHPPPQFGVGPLHSDLAVMRESVQRDSPSGELVEVVVDAPSSRDRLPSVSSATSAVCDATQTEEDEGRPQAPIPAQVDASLCAQPSLSYVEPVSMGATSLPPVPLTATSEELGVPEEVGAANGNPDATSTMTYDPAMDQSPTGSLPPPGAEGGAMMSGPPLGFPPPYPWKFQWPSDGSPGGWFYQGPQYAPYCLPPPVFNPGYPFMPPPPQPPMGFFTGYPAFPPPSEAPSYVGPTIPPVIVDVSEDTPAKDLRSASRSSSIFATPEIQEEDVYIDEPRQHVPTNAEHPEQAEHRPTRAEHRPTHAEHHATHAEHRPTHAEHRSTRSESWSDEEADGYRDDDHRTHEFSEARGNDLGSPHGCADGENRATIHEVSDYRERRDDRRARREASTRGGSSGQEEHGWPSRGGHGSWYRFHGGDPRHGVPSTPVSRRPGSSYPQRRSGRAHVPLDAPGRAATAAEARQDRGRAGGSRDGEPHRGGRHQQQQQHQQHPSHPHWESRPPTILQATAAQKALQHVHASNVSKAADPGSLDKGPQPSPPSSLPESPSASASSKTEGSGAELRRAHSVERLDFENPKFHPERFQIVLNPLTKVALAVVTKGNYFHNYLLQTVSDLKKPTEQAPVGL